MPVVIDSFIISTVTKNNFHGGVVACEYLLKVEVVCLLLPPRHSFNILQLILLLLFVHESLKGV